MSTVASLQESVGERVRNRRNALGMSQTDLARLTGMSQPNICDLEKGRHSPNLATIERIAEALGVAPKFFFGNR